MIRPRWFLGVSMAGLGPALVWAVAAQTSGSSAQQPETGHVPTFQANANLVLVDVVVRDRGKPVEGLRQTEFQVLEDGQPQTITVFEEHKGTDVQDAAEVPVLPPHVYGDFPKYRITSAANVLLLDALNTPLNDQGYARAQMLKYLRTIPPGTEIAVFTLASRLRMVSGFTTEPGMIEEALSLRKTPTQKSAMTPSGGLAEKQIDAAMTAGIPEIRQEVNAFRQDMQAFQEVQRMDITLGAFSELARYLSTVPGRKNLIWVSGGMSGALDPDLSRMSAPQAARYAAAVRTVNAELTRARVAVYPVDARALMALTDSNPANVVAPTEQMTLSADLQAARGEAMNNDVTIPRQWGESQEEMKLVATDTGGEAFYNTNAVGRAVEEAIADGSNYYTLGYAPPDGRKEGAYHRITVGLEEGKYELEYRRGYYAVDAGKAGQEMPTLSPITEAMEHGVPPLSQVIFEARVLPAGDPELQGLKPTPGPAGKPPEPLRAPVRRYFVDYSIDPHRLALKGLRGGKQQAELEVAQAVYDAEGKRLNFTDAGLEVTLTAAQVARDMRTGVRVRQEIDVPAAPVWLQLGVRDVTSGRIGTVELGLSGRE